MKKIVMATVMVAASVSVFVAPTLRAQDGSGAGQTNNGTISIKDPAEYNAYSLFSSQSDPKAKAAAGEDFLTKYPQSVVKTTVLNQLIDAYQAQQDMDKTVSAASRLLQIDPNNMKATFISAFIKKLQCGKTSDAQTCDDAAALATKGLTIQRPADVSDADWKNQTAAAYPVFHSAKALDAAVAHKDFKTAQDEYKAELMLYGDDQSSKAGLQDSLMLAQAYSQGGATQDLPNAVWFYARVWDFAPPAYKAQIEPKLEYYYKKYHGGLDGLDALKQQAQATTFPGAAFKIDPAKSPQEQIHDLLAQTPDLNTLALADKETVLAVGSKDDADKLWALLKDKQTPVPGVVIESTASQLKLAVTQDAKDSKTPDFIVNLKEPLKDEELKLYPAGFEFKLQPSAELDGTYDSYTQIPASATASASAQIVLREAFVQAEKKKGPVHHPTTTTHRKPAAGK